jgi:hypothetical protein
MFNDDELDTKELKMKTLLLLENNSFFVDYFYTIGLRHDIIFENFLYNEDLTHLNRNKRIKPEIITKFPDINKKHIHLSEDTLIKVNEF